VHNGIIENHVALRAELRAAGVQDPLRHRHRARRAPRRREVDGGTTSTAVRRALARLVEGAYAIAVLHRDEPGPHRGGQERVAAGHGLGDGETYCASDIPALLPYTRNMLLLEEGEMAVLTRQRRDDHDAQGNPVERAKAHRLVAAMAEKAATSTSC
jgi:glucosamine--fructose-6-phosphate aminotransferase (isomerizing)